MQMLLMFQTKWTELEDSKLAHAMQKFPPGTALRWEKIGQQLNQTPAEVLKRAKEIRTSNFSSSSSGTGSVAPILSKLSTTACKNTHFYSYAANSCVH